MAATNKQELAQAIDRILTNQEPIKNADQGIKIRQQTAQKLADEIDGYIQFQIGTRLRQILSSINAPGVDGSGVPVTAGPNFESLTRTS